MNAIVPVPRVAVNIREATMNDFAFIDSLQKMHGKQVGWMPTKALEGKIAAKQVIIAEEPPPLPSPGVPGEGVREGARSLFPSTGTPGEGREGVRLGYCMGQDQYFKRDDVGIIYQMNVVPAKQRGLIGAALVKAMFDRAAYGCKLFCCWCAQDIDANYFWESLGFVPLAFRAGSQKKSRTHIFWQRRIREGDTTTDWWFPAQTSNGMIKEDRLVLPIPPGVHWRDAMPRILPAAEKSLCLPEIKKKKNTGKVPVPPRTTLGRLQFNMPVPAKAEKPKRERKPKVKNDPKLVSAARELRDRWLEQVNDDPSLLLPAGKYEVSRELIAPAPAALLPAA